MQWIRFAPIRRIYTRRLMQAVALGVLLALTGGGRAQAASDTILPLGTAYQLTLPNPQMGADQLYLNHPTASNQWATDTLTITVPDSVSTDTDSDDVLDEEDACPDSDLRANVILDGCAFGVENILFEDGCTLADLVYEALASGGEVSLADLLAGLEEDGFLTAEEVETLVACANDLGEISDSVEISYRFYVSERGKKRGWLGEHKKHWVKAIGWWIARYNKQCQPGGYPEMVRAVDLGDVINDAKPPRQATKEEKEKAKAEAQHYEKIHFATKGADEARHRGSPLWVVGRDELADFVTTSYSTSTRTFHIGLFDGAYDTGGLTHGIWYHDTNMSAVRANPGFGNVQRGRWHEMGHLFGLYDNTGGIMDKDSQGYGDPEVWRRDWCETIAAHLKIAK